jgi:DNA-binding MarR family transcriptional regulator
VPPRPLPPGTPATRQARIANRLNSAAIHLLRRIAQHDGADGVTPARLSALSVLVYGGAQTLGELARRQGVSLPTMSRLVDALVRDGLTSRLPHAHDRRAVQLAVTPAGRVAMERARARRIERLAGELAALSRDELTALERALTALERLEHAVSERPETSQPPRRQSRKGAGR